MITRPFRYVAAELVKFIKHPLDSMQPIDADGNELTGSALRNHRIKQVVIPTILSLAAGALIGINGDMATVMGMAALAGASLGLAILALNERNKKISAIAFVLLAAVALAFGGIGSPNYWDYATAFGGGAATLLAAAKLVDFWSLGQSCGRGLLALGNGCGRGLRALGDGIISLPGRLRAAMKPTSIDMWGENDLTGSELLHHRIKLVAIPIFLATVVGSLVGGNYDLSALGHHAAISALAGAALGLILLAWNDKNKKIACIALAILPFVLIPFCGFVWEHQWGYSTLIGLAAPFLVNSAYSYRPRSLCDDDAEYEATINERRLEQATTAAASSGAPHISFPPPPPTLLPPSGTDSSTTGAPLISSGTSDTLSSTVVGSSSSTSTASSPAVEEAVEEPDDDPYELPSWYLDPDSAHPDSAH